MAKSPEPWMIGMTRIRVPIRRKSSEVGFGGVMVGTRAGSPKEGGHGHSAGF